MFSKHDVLQRMFLFFFLSVCFHPTGEVVHVFSSLFVCLNRVEFLPSASVKRNIMTTIYIIIELLSTFTLRIEQDPKNRLQMIFARGE